MRNLGLCCIALLAIATIACGSSGPSNPSGPTNDAGPSAPPYIYATVFTQEGGTIPPYFDFLEEVSVCTDGYQCAAPVSNATVKVNGAALTYDSMSGAYFGAFLIPEGAQVSLQVTVGSTVYSASGTQFTSAPTVTAPDAGAVWQASVANTITWTGGAPAAGANYFVQMVNFVPPSFHQAFPPSPQSGELPITSTSATVDAGTLPPATSFNLVVGIVTPGAILQNSGGIPIPDAGAGSGLWLGALSTNVGVQTQ